MSEILVRCSNPIHHARRGSWGTSKAKEHYQVVIQSKEHVGSRREGNERVVR